MPITSVRLQPEVEDSLEAIASKLDRSKSWIINQALREYIMREERDAARWAETLGAMESLAAGRVIGADEVHAWLASWGTEGETAAPKPR